MPTGENKAQALRRVCDMLQLDMSRILAVGDGENDKEMLRAAGLGCAMGNSNALARAAADMTIGANHADGLAEMVERILLTHRVTAPE